MSDFTFNVSLGREVEFWNNVDTNTPATSGFKLCVLAATGLEPDATLKDYATMAAVVAGTTNYVTNSGYAHKTLTDTETIAYTVDNSLDRIVLPFLTQTFTSIGAGDSWGKLVISYAPDVAGADSTWIPVTAHDLRISGAAIVPNGGNIVVSGPNGFVVCD